MIQLAIQKLVVRQDLTRDEVIEVMEGIADEKATPAQAGAFLAALRMKGETVEEITGAASVMRARVDAIKVDAPVFIDTCGTVIAPPDKSSQPDAPLDLGGLSGAPA